MSQQAERVIIGVDPHKLSATIEVVDEREQLGCPVWDHRRVTSPSESEMHASAVATVEGFVVRARRVRKHSLVADPEALAKLCNPSWHITVDPLAETSMVSRSLPAEEAVESLAARVRPLILQGDPVQHGKVLNALGFLLKDVPGTEEAKQYVKWLRDRWRGIDSSSDEMCAYRVEKGTIDRSSPPSVISDNSLAFAWFYGDVVHADASRRESSANFDITDRFEAAVPIVARAAWLAHATLDLIEKLRADGQLQISDQVFEEAVTVEVTEITHEATVYIAPPGTDAPPSIYDEFNDGWTRLADISMFEDEKP